MNFISPFNWDIWQTYIVSNWEYILLSIGYGLLIYLLRKLTFRFYRYTSKNNHYNSINTKHYSSRINRYIHYCSANNSHNKTCNYPHQKLPPILMDSLNIKNDICDKHNNKKDDSYPHDLKSTIVEKDDSTKIELNHFITYR
jgi:hypothetical protein